jgi:hypothetical protein
MTDAEIVERMAAEMANLGTCEFHFAAPSMLTCVGLLQLASRYQQLSDRDRRFIATFVEHARRFFARCPAVLDVIRRGDDPSQDVRPAVLQCPLCEWSARNEVEDESARDRIEFYLRRAFLDHIAREHQRQ